MPGHGSQENGKAPLRTPAAVDQPATLHRLPASKLPTPPHAFTHYNPVAHTTPSFPYSRRANR